MTTDPTRQTLAQDMANATINSIVQQNKVAGSPPVLASPPAFNFSNLGDPQITVTLQRTDLPTFFARIWGKRLATVTASATAEAYNPSNSQTNTGNYVPIAPKCVKPLLIPNKDPGSGSNFVDPNTGVATTGVIGETFGPPGSIPPLSDACPSGSATCGPPYPPQATQAGYYLPAAVTPNTANLCPSCTGSDDFEQSIECCDFNRYSCGAPLPTTVDTTGGPIPTSADTTMGGNTSRRDTRNGVQCLIHEPGQDTLDPASVANFIAGTGPMEITARSGPLSGKLVTTSSSIATLPIFDTSPTAPTLPQVTVVGFLQVFIGDVKGNGDITVTILNVAGCGNNPSSAPAVSGGGTSPIPVRLIHQ